MRAKPSLARQDARVWLEWAHQNIGWIGWIGLSLLLAAAGLFGWAWQGQQAWLQAAAVQPQDEHAATLAAVQPAAPRPSARTPELPGLEQVPSLLGLMERATVASGLEWRAASYGFTAATPNRPAGLEVRCTIRGPYPKLRNTLVQMQDTVPAFTIRELNISRPSSEAPEVDAKVALTVFLRDDSVASADSASVTPP